MTSRPAVPGGILRSQFVAAIGQFFESARLEQVILYNLKVLGYGG